ncbi:hypothetical protein ACWFQ8_30050 [Streptomyces sp. NPDC055254]
MNHQPTATGPSGQSGITHQVPVPLPVRPRAESPFELFVDGRGFLWRLAEDGPVGSRRFVPAAMAPSAVPRLAWAREGELSETCGALNPVERAA